MLERRKGIIFVVSAPSGTGKTTVCEKLIKECPGVYLSVSTTSRQPRKTEKHKKDYFFVTGDEFKDRIKQGKFVEWTKVLDKHYGTEHSMLKRSINKAEDVILSIDVEGARAIKKCYPDSVLFFLVPPSLSELKKRLQKRGSEDAIQLNKRLTLAKKELNQIGNYDYVIVNSQIKKAVYDLKCAIISERNRITRYNPQEIIRNIKKGSSRRS